MSYEIRTTGYLLWRSGLLIAGSSSLVWLGKWLVALWLLPEAITWGVALIAAGLAMILVSLVLESRRDVPPPDDDGIGVNP